MSVVEKPTCQAPSDPCAGYTCTSLDRNAGGADSSCSQVFLDMTCSETGAWESQRELAFLLSGGKQRVRFAHLPLLWPPWRDGVQEVAAHEPHVRNLHAL